MTFACVLPEQQPTRAFRVAVSSVPLERTSLELVPALVWRARQGLPLSRGPRYARRVVQYLPSVLLTLFLEQLACTSMVPTPSSEYKVAAYQHITRAVGNFSLGIRQAAGASFPTLRLHQITVLMVRLRRVRPRIYGSLLTTPPGLLSQ